MCKTTTKKTPYLIENKETEKFYCFWKFQFRCKQKKLSFNNKRLEKRNQGQKFGSFEKKKKKKQ